MSILKITPVLSYNSIRLDEIGTVFKLIENMRGNPDVELERGPEENMFIGNFVSKDVDFEIGIDNRLNDRTLRVELSIANMSKKFVIRAYDYTKLRTLETDGRHLHFLSAQTERGRDIIKWNANQFGMTLKEAEMVWSRIEFKNIEVLDSKRAQCRRTDGTQLAEDRPSSESSIGSDASGDLSLDSNVEPNEGNVERGVVCFGHSTQQKFKPYYGFVASNEYQIKPFTIELRVDRNSDNI